MAESSSHLDLEPERSPVSNFMPLVQQEGTPNFLDVSIATESIKSVIKSYWPKNQNRQDGSPRASCEMLCFLKAEKDFTVNFKLIHPLTEEQHLLVGFELECSNPKKIKVLTNWIRSNSNSPLIALLSTSSLAQTVTYNAGSRKYEFPWRSTIGREQSLSFRLNYYTQQLDCPLRFRVTTEIFSNLEFSKSCIAGSTLFCPMFICGKEDCKVYLIAPHGCILDPYCYQGKHSLSNLLQSAVGGHSQNDVQQTLKRANSANARGVLQLKKARIEQSPHPWEPSLEVPMCYDVSNLIKQEIEDDNCELCLKEVIVERATSFEDVANTAEYPADGLRPHPHSERCPVESCTSNSDSQPIRQPNGVQYSEYSTSMPIEAQRTVQFRPPHKKFSKRQSQVSVDRQMNRNSLPSTSRSSSQQNVRSSTNGTVSDDATSAKSKSTYQPTAAKFIYPEVQDTTPSANSNLNTTHVSVSSIEPNLTLATAVVTSKPSQRTESEPSFAQPVIPLTTDTHGQASPQDAADDSQQTESTNQANDASTSQPSSSRTSTKAHTGWAPSEKAILNHVKRSLLCKTGDIFPIYRIGRFNLRNLNPQGLIDILFKFGCNLNLVKSTIALFKDIFKDGKLVGREWISHRNQPLSCYRDSQVFTPVRTTSSDPPQARSSSTSVSVNQSQTANASKQCELPKNSDSNHKSITSTPVQMESSTSSSLLNGNSGPITANLSADPPNHPLANSTTRATLPTVHPEEVLSAKVTTFRQASMPTLQALFQAPTTSNTINRQLAEPTTIASVEGTHFNASVNIDSVSCNGLEKQQNNRSSTDEIHKMGPCDLRQVVPGQLVVSCTSTAKSQSAPNTQTIQTAREASPPNRVSNNTLNDAQAQSKPFSQNAQTAKHVPEASEVRMPSLQQSLVPFISVPQTQGAENCTSNESQVSPLDPMANDTSPLLFRPSRRQTQTIDHVSPFTSSHVRVREPSAVPFAPVAQPQQASRMQPTQTNPPIATTAQLALSREKMTISHYQDHTSTRHSMAQLTNVSNLANMDKQSTRTNTGSDTSRAQSQIASKPAASAAIYQIPIPIDASMRIPQSNHHTNIEPVVNHPYLDLDTIRRMAATENLLLSNCNGPMVSAPSLNTFNHETSHSVPICDVSQSGQYSQQWIDAQHQVALQQAQLHYTNPHLYAHLYGYHYSGSSSGSVSNGNQTHSIRGTQEFNDQLNIAPVPTISNESLVRQPNQIQRTMQSQQQTNATRSTQNRIAPRSMPNSQYCYQEQYANSFYNSANLFDDQQSVHFHDRRNGTQPNRAPFMPSSGCTEMQQYEGIPFNYPGLHQSSQSSNSISYPLSQDMINSELMRTSLQIQQMYSTANTAHPPCTIANAYPVGPIAHESRMQDSSFEYDNVRTTYPSREASNQRRMLNYYSFMSRQSQLTTTTTTISEPLMASTVMTLAQHYNHSSMQNQMPNYRLPAPPANVSFATANQHTTPRKSVQSTHAVTKTQMHKQQQQQQVNYVREWQQQELRNTADYASISASMVNPQHSVVQSQSSNSTLDMVRQNAQPPRVNAQSVGQPITNQFMSTAQSGQPLHNFNLHRGLNGTQLDQRISQTPNCFSVANLHNDISIQPGGTEASVQIPLIYVQAPKPPQQQHNGVFVASSVQTNLDAIAQNLTKNQQTGTNPVTITQQSRTNVISDQITTTGTTAQSQLTLEQLEAVYRVPMAQLNQNSRQISHQVGINLPSSASIESPSRNPSVYSQSTPQYAQTANRINQVASAQGQCALPNQIWATPLVVTSQLPQMSTSISSIIQTSNPHLAGLIFCVPGTSTHLIPTVSVPSYASSLSTSVAQSQQPPQINNSNVSSAQPNPPKRGRGRPRRQVAVPSTEKCTKATQINNSNVSSAQPNPPKRGRGRPRSLFEATSAHMCTKATQINTLAQIANGNPLQPIALQAQTAENVSPVVSAAPMPVLIFQTNLASFTSATTFQPLQISTNPPLAQLASTNTPIDTTPQSVLPQNPVTSVQQDQATILHAVTQPTNDEIILPIHSQRITPSTDQSHAQPQSFSNPHTSNSPVTSAHQNQQAICQTTVQNVQPSQDLSIPVVTCQLPTISASANPSCGSHLPNCSSSAKSQRVQPTNQPLDLSAQNSAPSVASTPAQIQSTTAQPEHEVPAKQKPLSPKLVQGSSSSSVQNGAPTCASVSSIQPNHVSISAMVSRIPTSNPTNTQPSQPLTAKNPILSRLFLNYPSKDAQPNSQITTRTVNPTSIVTQQRNVSSRASSTSAPAQTPSTLPQPDTEVSPKLVQGSSSSSVQNGASNYASVSGDRPNHVSTGAVVPSQISTFNPTNTQPSQTLTATNPLLAHLVFNDPSKGTQPNSQITTRTVNPTSIVPQQSNASSRASLTSAPVKIHTGPAQPNCQITTRTANPTSIVPQQSNASSRASLTSAPAHTPSTLPQPDPEVSYILVQRNSSSSVQNGESNCTSVSSVRPNHVSTSVVVQPRISASNPTNTQPSQPLTATNPLLAKLVLNDPSKGAQPNNQITTRTVNPTSIVPQQRNASSRTSLTSAPVKIHTGPAQPNCQITTRTANPTSIVPRQRNVSSRPSSTSAPVRIQTSPAQSIKQEPMDSDSIQSRSLISVPSGNPGPVTNKPSSVRPNPPLPNTITRAPVPIVNNPPQSSSNRSLSQTAYTVNSCHPNSTAISLQSAQSRIESSIPAMPQTQQPQICTSNVSRGIRSNHKASGNQPTQSLPNPCNAQTVNHVPVVSAVQVNVSSVHSNLSPSIPTTCQSPSKSTSVNASRGHKPASSNQSSVNRSQFAHSSNSAFCAPSQSNVRVNSNASNAQSTQPEQRKASSHTSEPMKEQLSTAHSNVPIKEEPIDSDRIHSDELPISDAQSSVQGIPSTSRPYFPDADALKNFLLAVLNNPTSETGSIYIMNSGYDLRSMSPETFLRKLFELEKSDTFVNSVVARYTDIFKDGRRVGQHWVKNCSRVHKRFRAFTNSPSQTATPQSVNTQRQPTVSNSNVPNSNKSLVSIASFDSTNSRLPPQVTSASSAQKVSGSSKPGSVSMPQVGEIIENSLCVPPVSVDPHPIESSQVTHSTTFNKAQHNKSISQTTEPASGQLQEIANSTPNSISATLERPLTCNQNNSISTPPLVQEPNQVTNAGKSITESSTAIGTKSSHTIRPFMRKCHEKELLAQLATIEASELVPAPKNTAKDMQIKLEPMNSYTIQSTSLSSVVNDSSVTVNLSMVQQKTTNPVATTQQSLTSTIQPLLPRVQPNRISSTPPPPPVATNPPQAISSTSVSYDARPQVKNKTATNSSIQTKRSLRSRKVVRYREVFDAELDCESDLVSESRDASLQSRNVSSPSGSRQQKPFSATQNMMQCPRQSSSERVKGKDSVATNNRTESNSQENAKASHAQPTQPKSKKITTDRLSNESISSDSAYTSQVSSGQDQMLEGEPSPGEIQYQHRLSSKPISNFKSYNYDKKRVIPCFNCGGFFHFEKIKMPFEMGQKYYKTPGWVFECNNCNLDSPDHTGYYLGPLKCPNLYKCFCNEPFDHNKAYVQCDRCPEHFHQSCFGLIEKHANLLPEFFCQRCTELNIEEGRLEPTYEEAKKRHAQLVTRFGKRRLTQMHLKDDEKRLEQIMTSTRFLKENDYSLFKQAINDLKANKYSELLIEKIPSGKYLHLYDMSNSSDLDLNSLWNKTINLEFKKVGEFVYAVNNTLHCLRRYTRRILKHFQKDEQNIIIPHKVKEVRKLKVMNLDKLNTFQQSEQNRLEKEHHQAACGKSASVVADPEPTYTTLDHLSTAHIMFMSRSVTQLQNEFAGYMKTHFGLDVNWPKEFKEDPLSTVDTDDEAPKEEQIPVAVEPTPGVSSSKKTRKNSSPVHVGARNKKQKPTVPMIEQACANGSYLMENSSQHSSLSSRKQSLKRKKDILAIDKQHRKELYSGDPEQPGPSRD